MLDLKTLFNSYRDAECRDVTVQMLGCPCQNRVSLVSSTTLYFVLAHCCLRLTTDGTNAFHEYIRLLLMVTSIKYSDALQMNEPSLKPLHPYTRLQCYYTRPQIKLHFPTNRFSLNGSSSLENPFSYTLIENSEITDGWSLFRIITTT